MKLANFPCKIWDIPEQLGLWCLPIMSVSPKTKKFSNKEEPIKMLLSHFRLIVDAEAAWQAWYQLNCNDGQKESWKSRRESLKWFLAHRLTKSKVQGVHHSRNFPTTPLEQLFATLR